MDQDCREQIMSEEYADLLIEYNNITSLEESGYCYSIIDSSTAVIHIPVTSLPANYVQLYGYGVNPSLYGLMDIPSIEASGVFTLRNLPVTNLLGQNVLVGIIDTGIDYTHEVFLHEDGSSRIVSIWDQTIQEGDPPEGFNYGTEYLQEEINEALQLPNPESLVATRDEIGHGTFLAGIAAGKPIDNENFSGVAPSSELVVVKLKQAKRYLKEFFRVPPDALAYQENDIMLAVSYLLQVSLRLQKPISICIGLGTSQGGHDEMGTLSSYLNSVATYPGVAISIAAGNEGNQRHHYFGVVSNNMEYDTIELRVGPDEYGFSMELWGNAPNTFSIDILSPTGEYIPRIPARINESREIRFIFEETIVNIDYFLIESQTGDQLILVRFLMPTQGIWRFRVYATGDLELSYHVWLPISNFISENTFFTESTPTTTVTSPGNTIIPMTVTAYDVANNSLYLNAGRGFSRTGIINPNFAAPGVNIIGPIPGNRYTVMSGTSIAAAHITGLATLLLEWGISLDNFPTLSSVEIKNMLIRGAIRSPTNVYPNTDWGYGIVNIYNTFINIRGDL
ncbi:MAG: S8 family peptidase [Clostridiales bacterium]|nr:S8 family peptidase [Clostridiales bacterium]